ncbi:nonfunctional serine recombinase [Skunkpox virus]|uniref:Protein OPG061 n=1 Tax=Skunkpox virus TaxID=160796 RepID=A0A1C9KBK5_9POXV|nr:nonfunctional serine recombinase [Skunkpox virus]AOP31532.1 nonfunctional serine recombinase [Skunkpox virus]
MKVAIVTSVASLLDASIQFQKTACRHYCNYLSMQIVKEIEEFGSITDKNLESDSWKDITKSDEIDALVFYRVKQISSSTGVLHEYIMRCRTKPISMYFVRDCLAFDGDPPSFRMTSCNINAYNRKKVKDLVILMNMKTCNKKIINEFIIDNFGSVDALLTIINSNVSWVTSVINNHSGITRRTSNNKILTITSFRRFVNKLKMYKTTKYTSQLDNLCIGMHKMDILDKNET